MTSVLLKYGVRAVALLVAIAAILVLFVIDPMSALATVIGGVLAGANFLGLVYIVSRLLDGTLPTNKKLMLGMTLLLKLSVVATLFWAALIKYRLPPLGLVIGLGAATFGLVLGLAKATSSDEGKAALDAEEKRIAREMSSKSFKE